MIHCWGQAFALTPANGATSDLTLPTHTPCFSLQTLPPNESNRAVARTFQIPGMA